MIKLSLLNVSIILWVREEVANCPTKTYITVCEYLIVSEIMTKTKIRPFGILSDSLIPRPFGLIPTPREVFEEVINRIETPSENLENIRSKDFESQNEEEKKDIGVIIELTSMEKEERIDSLMDEIVKGKKLGFRGASTLIKDLTDNDEIKHYCVFAESPRSYTAVDPGKECRHSKKKYIIHGNNKDNVKIEEIVLD